MQRFAVEPRRIANVQTPVIPAVAELIRDNPGTISLGQGVVNYGPPPGVVKHIEAFLANPGNHKYQHVQGIPELIHAIAHKLETENRIALADRDVVVTAGSNMGFLNAVLTITDPGDEVILLSPYYFNQEMALTLCGVIPVVVNTNEHYQPDLARIEAALTQRTRAVVTISPNNPTGVVYTREQLDAVNELCAERGIFHVSDEAYEHFTYAGAKHYSPASRRQSEAHTISLFSLSKGFGFASWRIGYMVVPRYLTGSIKKVQDTNLICPPVVSQHAALAAFEAGRAYCESHVDALGGVRLATLEQLDTLSDRVTIPDATGAFYFLIQVDSGLEPMTLVERLVKEHKVAVIPGSTFGVTEVCTLRIAYAALEPDGVAIGVERLVSGLRQVLG